MIRKVKSYLIKKFPKFMQKKLVLLYGVIILAFVVLVGRVTYINARSGDEYTSSSMIVRRSLIREEISQTVMGQSLQRVNECIM